MLAADDFPVFMFHCRMGGVLGSDCPLYVSHGGHQHSQFWLDVI